MEAVGHLKGLGVSKKLVGAPLFRSPYDEESSILGSI